MRRIFLYVIAMVVAFSLVPPSGYPSPARSDLPLVGGKPALARINGEPLLLEEFERALSGIHSGASDNTTRSMSKPSVLLERLINAKLVLQEARNIGLDALPEVRSAQKAFEEDTLRGMLYGFHVRNIRTPDKKAVEKRYREAVKEVKVISVLFDKEEDARRLEADVKAGGRFEELAQKKISGKAAKGSVEGQYLKISSLGPEAAKAVFHMKKGEVSPVIRIGKEFSLLKLEDIRYPKDEAARRQAEKDALQAKKAETLKAYSEGLRKKYVKIDRKLFDNIDFDAAGAGIGRLRADERVLAAIKGEKPVTVGDLTAALEKKFFHGAERAAEEKKINSKKEQTLEEILNKRVALLEAKKQKLERTDYFKVKAQEHRNGALFGTFVQKVIVPDVKVGEEELHGYYQAHINEYTFPEMVRIDGLVFADKGPAESAIEKLRKGADFQWLRANADGQVDSAKGKDLLEFKGQLLTVATLPDSVREAIAGAGAGDYRLYADPGNAYYVLDLLERIPSRPMPLESVKGEMEKKLFSEKLQLVLRDWEEKLRKASDVKIYATGKKLDGIVNPGGR
ncbi:MAG: peptidyl-prolyl cis-trans isomerase [Deltaproteobacteria bacterium]|nr:peptidyl-prolyl cis-trans isomerase [Deltaproteobacteria bacterium]